MRKFFAISLVATLLFASGALVACGGGNKKTVNVPGGGKVSVSDKLPDSFPDDLPVPNGADVQGSYSGEQGGIEGVIATWSSDDSVDDVKSFYEDELGGDGPWVSDSKGDLGGSAFFTAKNKDGSKLAYILVSEVDNKTSLVITVGDNTDSVDNGDDSAEDTPTSSDGDDSSSDGSSGDSSEDVSLPAETDLPDDFPSSEVPLPSGARITSATSFTSNGISTHLIELYSKDSVDDLKDEFKSKLEGNGWTEALTTTTNGEVFATYTKGEGTDNGVLLTIGKSEVDGYNRVSVSVTTKAD
ncbi:MAG TPA: hypothetical protein VIH21_06200 [Dehalococcoidia bacterium]